MKHTFFKASKIAFGIFLSSLLIFSTNSASAKSSKKQTESNINISPAVSFAGTDVDGAAFISVAFETPAPIKFEVIMKDANGNEFFSRDFESARFLKTFKLVNNADGFGSMELTLSIRLTDTGKTYDYKVSSTVNQAATVSVSKL